ncbi:hypothetical protein V6N13_001639 [Hibiscus sabdariffa]
MFQTSVSPLAMYPPPGSDFDFNYGIVQHTSSISLFATGPSGNVTCDYDEDEDKEDDAADDDEDDGAGVV